MCFSGRVAEWPIASVLKTEVLQGTVGSNPTSSENKPPLGGFFSEEVGFEAGGPVRQDARRPAPE